MTKFSLGIIDVFSKVITCESGLDILSVYSVALPDDIPLLPRVGLIIEFPLEYFCRHCRQKNTKDAVFAGEF